MKAPVSTEESLRRLYGRDQGDVPPVLRWLFTAPEFSIVLPRTEEEAIEAVREAYAKGVPIVARGAGSTGLGQTSPVLGGLVIDTGFLNRIHAFSAEAGTVTVDAGVRWSDLAAFLAERHCAVGSYPSSWASTVGGWVQTGGCGILTHRFGPLCRQVPALRACVADGRVIDLQANHAEFDAFFQTEGQMGLLLRATLRIRPAPEGQFPLLVECKDPAEAWELYAQARAQQKALVHAAVYNAARMRRMNATFKARMEAKQSGLGQRGLVSGAPAALLYVETREEWLKLRGWVRGRGRIETPAHVAGYVWAERHFPLKGKTAAQSLLGSELTVPDARAAACAAALEALAAQQGIDLVIEATAAGPGEAILIASFHAPAAQTAFLSLVPLVLRMDRLGVERFGARIYQVGAYNTAFVDRKFPREKLLALRATKARLDPKWLFNPAKFFDFRTRFTSKTDPAKHWKVARWVIPRVEGRAWLVRLLAKLAKLLPAPRELKPTADALLKTARECVGCGSCIPVCPAYLVRRDERTTPRGKLRLAEGMEAGHRLSAKDVELLHGCMHCSACTEVCQSALDLVPAWRALEERAAAAGGGKPAAAIETFVKDVEASPEYKRLLRRGYSVERESGAKS